MSQWQNLPVPSNSEGNQGWASFSTDPRDPQFAHLRASNADRGAAASILSEAYADGRLDSDEYEQRMGQVSGAKSLGELVPVLSDLAIDQQAPGAAPAPPPQVAAPAPDRRNEWLGPFPRWWIALAVLFNVIWIMTSFSAGRPLYYWPMWPMMGTALPWVLAMISGGNRRLQRPQQPPQNPQLPPGRSDDLR